MSKKVLICLAVIMVLLALAVPATAFASGNETPGAERETVKDVTTTRDADDAVEMEEPEQTGITAQALTSVGPSKYTQSLSKRDSDEYGYYYYELVKYTAPSTGIYTYFSLTTQDTDLILRNSSMGYIDGDTYIDTPFQVWFYMKAGVTYYLEFRNYGSSKSVTYLRTTPVTLSNAANTMTSNGHSKVWKQGFAFTANKAGLYSLHTTCPASCTYYVYVYKYIDDDTFELVGSSGAMTREWYKTLTLLSGSYHISLLLVNSSSANDTYTIAMDNHTVINEGIREGVTYTRSIAANDNFTAHNFIPSETGNYKITCSRSDAKLTVITDGGTRIVDNAAPNRNIALTGGEDAPNYYFYFVTPASSSAGSISYSATLLSSDATISGISTSMGTLSPAYNKDVKSYELKVDSEAASSVTITPKATAPGGTFVINGSARSSISIPLTATTSQAVTIRYTSSDGSQTSDTYTVLVKSKSRACDVTSASAPFALDVRVLSAAVDSTTTSQAVDLSVSPAATWKLYSNKACTAELADKTVSLPAEGLHRAYVKVTCESGRHSKIYPVLVYRLGSADPAVVAYDPNYNEISDNAIVKSDVRGKLIGNPALTPSVNGGAIAWPASGLFTATGNYEIALTDGNDNTADISFTIDKTAPVITAKDTANAVIKNGAWAKNPVKITVTDLTTVTKTAKKNGAAIAWPAGDTFTADGSYSIEATDSMGNKSAYSFMLDRTMPAVLAKCGKTVLSNNAYVKSSVVVTVSDTNYVSKSVTKNGAALAWPSSNKFSSAAAYVVTVIDKGGNATVFKFTIDNIAPKITAKAGKKTIKNKGKTKYDVTLTVTEANIAAKTITMGGAAIAWPANNILKTEGYYVAAVTDKTGSKATLSFTIDKMPVVTLRTVSGKTLANKALTGESVNITITEKFLSSKTLKKSGKTVKWPSNGQVTADGSYTLYVKDKIGNKVTLAFTIDKTAPKITAKAKKTVANGGAVKDSRVTVSISDLIAYTKTATQNGKAMSWPSKSRFTAEGVYVITAKDALNHQSTFTFTIDRSAPVITAKTAGTQRNVTSGMTVNENVVVTISDRVGVTPTVTRNGAVIAMPSGRTFKDNGTYTVKAKNALGYTSATFTFTINKASPAITARDSANAVVVSGGVTKNNVTVTATGATQKAATRNGTAYTYPTNGVFTAEGAYVVTARDASGNTATFSFTIDRTAPVISGGDSSGTISNNGVTNKDVTVTVTGANQTTATRNSAAYTYPAGGVFAAEGEYVVTAADAVGNTSTFAFTIDKTGPEITAADSDTAAVNSDDFTTKDVTVTVTGAEEIRVNKDGIGGYGFPAEGLFSEEGRFVIEARDTVGNWTTFIFSIDRTPPDSLAVQLLSDATPVAEGSTVTSNVVLTIISSEPNEFASVVIGKDGAVYKKYPLSDGEDVSLLWDVAASPMIVSENGVYEITVADKAGNEFTFSFTLVIE